MLLEARSLSFRYTARSPYILRSVSLEVDEGERVGVIAPSGYGKTTFVSLLAGYEQPTEGQILLDGKPLPVKGALPVQLICQHPENAINPRWRMSQVLDEAGQLRDDVIKAMGIEQEWLTRYPRELSGGELQRFCIARSLRQGTRFVIADEMSTMLDVITQAQIWSYLLAEAERRRLGLVVVTHNPALAERVCTRIVNLADINHIDTTEDKR